MIAEDREEILQLEDQRRGPKSAPFNKLTDEERAKIIAVSTGTEFMDKSPRQIVPLLADRGENVASEASFYLSIFSF